MNGVEGIRGRAGEAVERFPTQSLLVNLCVFHPSPSLAFYSTWYLQDAKLQDFPGFFQANQLPAIHIFL